MEGNEAEVRLPLTHTATEVAAMLRVSERHVYEMANRGEFPGAVRMGRRWIFPRRAVLALLGEPVSA
jgi:excisionase family DNA binding protein